MKSVLSAAMLLGTAATARAAEYDLDPSHTSVQFSVRHMMVSTVRGQFAKLTGAVTLDEASPEKSSVQVAIDTASIDTRDAKRDEHLRSGEFFDASKHPQITFKSTRVERSRAGRLLVTGDLSMHGVVRPVVLEVEGPSAEAKTPWGGAVRGFSASTKLNRKDWGLTWNKTLEAGGVLVGEEVTLTIDGELKPRAAAAKAK